MAEGSSATCKDCHKPIKWTSRNGRWIPLEPRTDDRHRCQIDRTCEGPGCGKGFQGAPWMKLCPMGVSLAVTLITPTMIRLYNDWYLTCLLIL